MIADDVTLGACPSYAGCMRWRRPVTTVLGVDPGIRGGLAIITVDDGTAPLTRARRPTPPPDRGHGSPAFRLAAQARCRADTNGDESVSAKRFSRPDRAKLRFELPLPFHHDHLVQTTLSQIDYAITVSLACLHLFGDQVIRLPFLLEASEHNECLGRQVADRRDGAMEYELP
jgi:hypothetical protein